MNFLPAAVFGLGPQELIIILLIILLLFGSTKLPSLARALGQSAREFRKAAEGSDEEKKEEKKEEKEETKAES